MNLCLSHRNTCLPHALSCVAKYTIYNDRCGDTQTTITSDTAKSKWNMSIPYPVSPRKWKVEWRIALSRYPARIFACSFCSDAATLTSILLSLPSPLPFFLSPTRLSNQSRVARVCSLSWTLFFRPYFASIFAVRLRRGGTWPSRFPKESASSAVRPPTTPTLALIRAGLSQYFTAFIIISFPMLPHSCRKLSCTTLNYHHFLNHSKSPETGKFIAVVALW